MSRIYDRLESATLHFTRSGAIKERLEGAWRQCLAHIESELTRDVGLSRAPLHTLHGTSRM